MMYTPLLSAVLPIVFAGACAAPAPALPPAVDHLVPRPAAPLRPAVPGRPDDGLLGRGKFEVTVKLPAELLALVQHVDEDRGGIAGYVFWAFILATVATVALALVALRYVCGAARRAPETRPPWR